MSVRKIIGLIFIAVLFVGGVIPIILSDTYFKNGVLDIIPKQISYVTVGDLSQQSQNHNDKDVMMLGYSPYNTLNIIYIQFVPTPIYLNYGENVTIRLKGVWNGYLPSDTVYLSFMLYLVSGEWNENTITYTTSTSFTRELLTLFSFPISVFADTSFEIELPIPEAMLNMTSLKSHSLSIEILEVQGLDPSYYGYCVFAPENISLEVSYSGIQLVYSLSWLFLFIGAGVLLIILTLKKQKTSEVIPYAE